MTKSQQVRFALKKSDKAAQCERESEMEREREGDRDKDKESLTKGNSISQSASPPSPSPSSSQSPRPFADRPSSRCTRHVSFSAKRFERLNASPMQSCSAC